MAGDEAPSSPAGFYHLQQPEKLRDVLARDRVDNCLSCRLTGATAFMGLGAYSYFSGQKQLRLQSKKIVQSGSMFGMKSRQASITGIAIGLMGMGVYRLVN